MAGQTLYQLRLEIQDSLPVIWRTLIVPAQAVAWDAGSFINTAFGWSGLELASFTVGDQVYDDPDLYATKKGDPNHHDAGQARISDILTAEGEKAVYVYDQKARWGVDVKLSKVFTDENFPYPVLPVCIGGNGANPPEACGGIDGFYDMVDHLDRANDQQRQDIMLQAGLSPYAHFDAMAFDPARANQIFAHNMLQTMRDRVIPQDIEELKNNYLELLSEKVAADTAQAIEQEQTRQNADEYRTVMEDLETGSGDYDLAEELYGLDQAEAALGLDDGASSGASLDDMMKRMGSLGLLDSFDKDVNPEDLDLDKIFGKGTSEANE